MASSKVSGVSTSPRLILVALSLLFLSASVAGRSMKLPMPELHPIDICIFSCDMCFKGEALVTCANECITTEGLMDNSWGKVCRMFEGHGIRDLFNTYTP